MKAPLLLTLLAAGVLFSGATASATDEPVLVRQAQTLACLSAEMDDAFHTDLRDRSAYRTPSRVELGFRETLCHLAGIASQFRDAVDRHASAHELERGYAAMSEAFECVCENASGVPMRTSIRGMMQQFAQGMACVEHLDFEAASRHVANHHDHHHHTHPQESYPRGIYFRVPVPQSVPFHFRQPMP